jgi:hypothetical protein
MKIPHRWCPWHVSGITLIRYAPSKTNGKQKIIEDFESKKTK